MLILFFVIVPENAAKIIQSHFRRSVQFRRYMKIKKAACLLQTAIRAWLSIKSRLPIKQFGELNRHIIPFYALFLSTFIFLILCVSFCWF